MRVAVEVPHCTDCRGGGRWDEIAWVTADGGVKWECYAVIAGSTAVGRQEQWNSCK